MARTDLSLGLSPLVHPLLVDILTTISSLDHFSISHIKREGNQSADGLARLLVNSLFYPTASLPAPVRALILADMHGVRYPRL